MRLTFEKTTSRKGAKSELLSGSPSCSKRFSDSIKKITTGNLIAGALPWCKMILRSFVLEFVKPGRLTFVVGARACQWTHFKLRQSILIEFPETYWTLLVLCALSHHIFIKSIFSFSAVYFLVVPCGLKILITKWLYCSVPLNIKNVTKYFEWTSDYLL